VNFCKTGNPNGDGLPQWQPYRISGGIMILNTGAMVMEKKYLEEFEFLSQW